MNDAKKATPVGEKPTANPDPAAEEPPAPAAKPKTTKRRTELEKREHRLGVQARRLREANIAEAEALAALVARDAASAATARPRHYIVAALFVVIVVLPTLVAAWYLWARAVDQYATDLAFTVRQEEARSPVELLGGLSNLTAQGSSDTDILYKYIKSQELVAKIDASLDLRTVYSAHYDIDPVFGFRPESTIEDLVDHWRRMVRISYDPGSGMIELQVLAFDPLTAKAIAEQIIAESSVMINELSAIAREDTTRFAREELDQAVARLKSAREAVTDFRSRTQIVDPSADLQGQMGLLNTLQQQLAEALIEQDLLQDITRPGDPRIDQVQRRIAVIENRIAAERRKFGVGGEGPGGEDYASLLAEYEGLSVDREFAERTYTAALSAYDLARAEAQRQSRYLATFIRPGVAEKSEYPRRYITLGLIAMFLFMAWATLALVYYSLRDRR